MSMTNPNTNIAQISTADRLLISALENGLPLVRRPYAQIAKQLNTTEENILERLKYLIDSEIIKRYGVVVRHKELGYTANGMVVWDIPDDRVDELGICIGKYAYVTLSYRRPRILPDWPYNLFTMVHGRNREEVTHKVNNIIKNYGLEDINHTILFSTRRFKQRGASYTQNKHRQTKELQQPRKLRLIK